MTLSIQCRACQADATINRGQKGKYSFLECGDCGTVQVFPWPSLAELSAFYADYGKDTHYAKKKDRKISRAKNRIKRFYKKAPGKKLLDVGCNFGFSVKAALDLGLDAYGIDIDPPAIAIANQSFGEGRFESITVEDYATRGEKADMIYTSEVAEHVPDPDSYVRAMSKILNTGGYLFLTTPDASHWAVPKVFTQWKEVKPPEHITYYSRKGLKTLLARHGLDVVKFYFSFKPGMKVLARKVK